MICASCHCRAGSLRGRAPVSLGGLSSCFAQADSRASSAAVNQSVIHKAMVLKSKEHSKSYGQSIVPPESCHLRLSRYHLSQVQAANMTSIPSRIRPGKLTSPTYNALLKSVTAPGDSMYLLTMLLAHNVGLYLSSFVEGRR